MTTLPTYTEKAKALRSSATKMGRKMGVTFYEDPNIGDGPLLVIIMGLVVKTNLMEWDAEEAQHWLDNHAA